MALSDYGPAIIPLKGEDLTRKRRKTNVICTKTASANGSEMMEESPPEHSSLLDKRSLNFHKRKINKSLYKHFIVNSKNLLLPAQLHPSVEKEYADPEFKIQRINKKHSKYIRLSVKANGNATDYPNSLLRIAESRTCTLKEQSLERNLELENKKASEKSRLSIMSLNINGLNSKKRRATALTAGKKS